METFLFVWTYLSGIVLATWLADRKGHGTLQGFLFGLFFGPLGVIAIGLAPSAEERAAEELAAAQRAVARAKAKTGPSGS